MASDADKLLESIKTIERSLDKILTTLEKVTQDLIVLQYESQIPYKDKYPSVVKDTCPVCNMDYKNMTNYVCGNMNCPSGGVVWST